MQKIISYIGAKSNLYDFLDEKIFSNFDKNNSNINFLDLFAGTHAISLYLDKNTNWNLYSNDFSQYSYDLFYYLYFNKLTNNELKEIIRHLEVMEKLPLINGDIFNEFSMNGIPKSIEENKKEEMFSNQPYNSRMFFPERAGKKIDSVKKYLKENFFDKGITNNVYYILKIFLIEYADKNKNTTSVYGAYLKHNRKKGRQEFINKKLLNILKEGKNKKILKSYKEDIIKVLNTLKKEKLDKKNTIIYLDPPYSTRTYENNYHILNYISDMNFSINDIKFNTKTATVKNKQFNLLASKKNTYIMFEKMIIESLNICNNLYISYNTDGIVKQEDIEDICNKINNIKLITHSKNYRRYKSANIDNNNDLKEIIWEIKYV